MFFPRAAVVRYFFRYLASKQCAGFPDWAMDDLTISWKAGRPNTLQMPVFKDEQLSSLHVPTLVLFGSEDPLYDMAKAASRLSSVAPRIQVKIIPDAGHLFPIEKPEATNRALVDFLG